MTPRTKAPSWSEQAEGLAISIRRRAGTEDRSPPSAVAAALGYQVRQKPLLDGFDGYTLEGGQRIVVAKGTYRPRQEFTIAHELAEAHCDRTLSPGEHEQFCDAVASALLLPAGPFLQTLFARRLDLSVLRREEWPWASWEALAARVSVLLPGVVAAAWVNSEIKWRTQDGPASSAEVAALRDARRRGRGVVLSAGLVATAWNLAPRGARFRAVSLCLPVGR